MDRKKMTEQAKVLQTKKMARIAQLAKQLRPQVEAGVVKFSSPQPRNPQDIKQFTAPPAPVRTARTVVPKQLTVQQQEAQQQKLSPKRIVSNKSKGCSGCRRKIGK